MVKIKFPDGAIRSYESGLTPYEIASSISSGLARSIISSDFNGQKIETTTQIFDDGNLTFYTWKDNEGKEAFWHSTGLSFGHGSKKETPIFIQDNNREMPKVDVDLRKNIF